MCLLGTLLAVPAFAEGGASGPLDTINNLSDLVFQCVRAVGVIVAGYGIVQIGLAVQSHDSSPAGQRLSGIFRRPAHHVCKGDFGLYYGVVDAVIF